MCAKEKKRGREKEEKRKGKGRGKWGSKSFCLFVFISPRACFFIWAVVIFLSIEKTISRVRKLYPLLFEIKILIASQLGGL